ncbi:MAG TPA: hypothetical protein VFZ47_05170, partial [Chitinophagaceae bacterium]
MKPILLFALVLTLTNALASPVTDSIPDNSYPALFRSAYQPIFRLTEEDITHLPFTNIIEVINGRFPFVFADPPSTSQYTFLVDGYLALNINSINVSQIALIEYYPVSLDPGGGFLALKGTFVITTKARNAGRSGFSIRSQGGITMPTEKIYLSPGQFKLDLQNGFFTHQEIGYDHVGKKLQLSASGSFTSSPDPSYNMTDATGMFWQTNDISNNRVRFSMFGGYAINKKVRVSLALLGTSLREKTEGYSENTPLGRLSDFRFQDDVPYYGGAIGVDLNLSPYFSNTLQVEYSRWKSRNNFEQMLYAKPPTIPGPDQYAESYHETRNSRVAVINTMRGTFDVNKPTVFGWQFIVRYHELDTDGKYWFRVSQPPGTLFQYNEGEFFEKQRLFALMPGVSLNVSNRVIAQAGITYETDRDRYVNYKSKVLPYVGVRWNIPVDGTKLSDLQIHSSISQSPWANNSRDPLDFYQRPGTDPVTSPYYAPDLKYGYTWITGINAGFGNNRITSSVNFLLGNVYTTVLIPGGQFDNRKINRSGISLDAQAAIANSESFSCKLRTMLFYERFDFTGPKPAPVIYVENPLLNDDLSPQVRGSISADVTAGRFFAQVQGLLRFRDEGYNDDLSGEREPLSNHGLTFLVIGYSFGSENPNGFKCDVSVQTRNLLMMKEPRA